MEFSGSIPKPVQPRTALVQGEMFRCVAVETTPGRWTNVQDGKALPPVLEILQIMDNGDSLSRGKMKEF
jgi:hypothetical protein